MDSNRQDPERGRAADAPERPQDANAGRDPARDVPDDEPPTSGVGWWLVALLLLAFSTAVTYCQG